VTRTRIRPVYHICWSPLVAGTWCVMERPVCARVSTRSSGGRSPTSHGPADTAGERQLLLLQLIASGLPDKGAAEVMFVSTRTYRRELSAAMRKLGAATRAEAVATAIRLGHLVEDGDGWSSA